jgi:large subunit ribosomal protein L29
MKASEIRKMTTEEVVEQLGEHRQELFNLRFQQSTRQLSNPSRIGLVSHDIARMETVMRERKLAQQSNV